MTTSVKFPTRRYDMIGCLEELSDFEMQKREWVKSDHPCWFSSQMSFPSDMLFNEGGLDHRSANDLIGYWFVDEKESSIVDKLAKKFHHFTQTVGYGKPDSVYVNSPLWQEVVQAAKEAYDYIMTYEDMDDLLRQCREE